MIAKGKAIAHGPNAIRYAMRSDKKASLVDSNLVDGRTPAAIIRDFEAVNHAHSRCRNKYLRFEIGIAPRDEQRMTIGMLMKIAARFSKKMGLRNHQWIAYTHRDTDNLHMHLIANRIGIDGTVYQTDFVSNRASRAAEEISRELGLVIANEVHREREYRNVRADPQREAVKGELRRIAYDELGRGYPTVWDFFAGIQGRGVGLEPTINGRGELYGLRLAYRGETFKASEVGREFGMRSLFNQFGERFPGQAGTSKVPKYAASPRREQAETIGEKLLDDALSLALKPSEPLPRDPDHDEDAVRQFEVYRPRKKKSGPKL